MHAPIDDDVLFDLKYQYQILQSFWEVGGERSGRDNLGGGGGEEGGAFLPLRTFCAVGPNGRIPVYNFVSFNTSVSVSDTATAGYISSVY